MSYADKPKNMGNGYVEAGWSEEEVKEAVELLNQGQTVYYFKDEYWDHRMLRHAVESELAARYDRKRLKESAEQEE